MSITPHSTSISGTAFQREHVVVTVHDGRRGAVGPEGDGGDKGDQGDSLIIRGGWVLSTTYCPNDAVSWRSTVVNHVNSLYVQRSDQPCSPSTIEPHLDAARWEEIGAVDYDNAFGGIWEVTQTSHGFTKIGTPVAFNGSIYTGASDGGSPALGIVREVKNADQFTMQSSGEVPEIDDTVIFPAASSWIPGSVYYVSPQRGFVQLEKPIGYNTIQPILIPTDLSAGGIRNGVALPWLPTFGPGQEYVTVGWLKYYYTATSGQTKFEGADDNGNVLEHQADLQVDVFQNGLNLIDTAFSAVDPLAITLTTPAITGDTIEIWTPNRPLDVLVPSTVVKLDNIEAQFNSITTRFPLLVSAAALPLQPTLNTMVWMDGVPQEGLLDYILIEDPGNPGGGESWIEFAEPPPATTRFWGVTYVPVSTANLNDLADVSITNPQAGDTLTFNGATWENL